MVSDQLLRVSCQAKSSVFMYVGACCAVVSHRVRCLADPLWCGCCSSLLVNQKQEKEGLADRITQLETQNQALLARVASHEHPVPSASDATTGAGAGAGSGSGALDSSIAQQPSNQGFGNGAGAADPSGAHHDGPPASSVQQQQDAYVMRVPPPAQTANPQHRMRRNTIPTTMEHIPPVRKSRGVFGTLLDTMLWPFTEIGAVLSEAVGGVDDGDVLHESSAIVRV